MFQDCKALETLNLGSFSPAKATSLQGMFVGCKSLKSLDLSRFSTASATDMTMMFHGCTALKTLDLTSLNTANVTCTNAMFYGCSALEVLDLGSFDMSSAGDVTNMFGSCGSLRTIYAANSFAIPAGAYSNNMFSGCTSLVGGSGSVYDAAHVDAEYARVDRGATAPGYLAGKMGDVNGNGRLNAVDAQIAYDIATTTFYQDRLDYAAMRARADVTGAPGGGPDGQVTANDAFAIQYAELHGWGA